MNTNGPSPTVQPPLQRSRNGCSTCKGRRKKCDEKHPACGYCSEHRLPCDWRKQETSLADRRRGLGPLKWRTGWMPRSLLPNTPSPPIHGVVYQNEAPIAVAGSPQMFGIFELDIENSNSINEWHQMVPDPMLLLDQSSALDEIIDPWRFSPSNSFPFSDEPPRFVDFQEVQTPGGPPSSFGMPNSGTRVMEISNTVHPLPGLLPHFTNLPDSMELSQPEYFALYYYQTTLSLSHTTKDPLWSTSMVFLRQGSNRPLVMHLLLASSLKSLVSNHEVKNLAETREIAKHYFHRGKDLLRDELKKSINPDHISVLIAFWFLYTYRSRQANLNMDEMMHLSQKVANYVRKHELDRLCTCSSTDCTSVTTPHLSVRRRSLLARLLIWIFYADVSFEFRYRGGRLAEYLLQDSETADKVYKKSTVILQLHWGPEYPTQQVSDDIENSMVLKMLYETFKIYHAINKLSYDTGMGVLTDESMEKELIYIEEEYAQIFALANSSTPQRSRLLQNADWVASLFYAIRIYYFRSTNLETQTPRPPIVEKALCSLLGIAYRTYTSNQTEIYRCPQWPLLIVGAETSDPIHREWILNHMSPDVYKKALGQIILAQGGIGGSMRVSQLRGMCDVGVSDEDAQRINLKRIGFGAWC